MIIFFYNCWYLIIYFLAWNLHKWNWMSLWKMLWIWTSTKNLWMILIVIVTISLPFATTLSILILCIWQVLQQLFQYWYFAFGKFCGCYILVELCYCEFGLKCIHFFRNVKGLFSRWMLCFCWTMLFWMWIEDLKCMHYFRM